MNRTIKNTIITVLNSFFITLFINITVISCSPEANDAKISKPAEASPKLAKTVPVEAMALKYKTLEHKISFTSVIEPTNEIDIISEVSGKVIRINKGLGSVVTTKDTLAYIDDEIPFSNYQQASAALQSALSSLEIAKLNLESDKELYATKDISELAYEQSVLNVRSAKASLLSSQAQLNRQRKEFLNTRITSPINGLISRKEIQKGTMVSPGMALYHIVNNNTFKVVVGVPQDVIAKIKNGDFAEIYVSALKETVKGKVKFISPQADAQSGAFTVEIHLQNNETYSIKAGMTASVNIYLSSGKKLLSLPEYALVHQNGSDKAYKIEGGKAKLTEFTSSEKFGGEVIINNGFNVGDTIVVVGMKNLGVNSKVFIEQLH
jgi:RND family efflux transporter MFP subunit